MKQETHPTYHDEITATCSCGAEFKIGSVMEEMKVEICSNCHPFYTGQEKSLDTAGRVDRFNKRFSKKQ